MSRDVLRVLLAWTVWLSFAVFAIVGLPPRVYSLPSRVLAAYHELVLPGQIWQNWSMFATPTGMSSQFAIVVTSAEGTTEYLSLPVANEKGWWSGLGLNRFAQHAERIDGSDLSRRLLSEDLCHAAISRVSRQGRLASPLQGRVLLTLKSPPPYQAWVSGHSKAPGLFTSGQVYHECGARK